ncbi:MAG TPA: hypothetical protein VF411_01595 [Bacteroidia bacterium]
MKTVIKPRDQVFATGVFLQRTEDNHWIVASFESDTYFDGKIVNQVESDAPYTGDDEDE